MKINCPIKWSKQIDSKRLYAVSRKGEALCVYFLFAIWRHSYCGGVQWHSYKTSTIVIYDSRVIPDLKIPLITTQES